MSVGKEGGPAFPQHLIETRDGAFEASYNVPNGSGMSLRDYFAAKAMQAELASSSFGDAAEQLAKAATQRGISIEARISENAYRLADAMLEARKK